MLSDPESGIAKPACVIVEAVQGEGGVIPAPPEWLAGLRALTARLDIALVIDEVQTGIGRTGAMFAFEHSGIRPDAVVLSKAIGGGFPLALVAYDERYDVWEAGAHAGTFRGNQIAMAAGVACLDVIESEGLIAGAAAKEAHVRARLERLAARHPEIGDVRGAASCGESSSSIPTPRPTRPARVPPRPRSRARSSGIASRTGSSSRRAGATVRSCACCRPSPSAPPSSISPSTRSTPGSPRSASTRAPSSHDAPRRLTLRLFKDTRSCLPESPPHSVNYRKKYATEAHALSAIRPWRCAWVIARQWIGIAIAFALPIALVARLTGGTSLAHAFAALGAPQRLGVAAALGAAYVYLACKQHALGIVMHDATHFRLFESRRVNELVGNWLCAFPIGMVTSCYRRSHLPHHLFTNKPNDPYWARLVEDAHYAFPMSRAAFGRILLGDVFGANLRAWWPTLRSWTGWSSVLDNREKLLTPSERRQFVAFWIGALALAAYFGVLSYFLLLWVLPMFTLSLAFIRLRVIAEHDLEKAGHELERTRHVDGGWFERLAIAPLNINYHVAHHLFPSVPLYNLPKMHALLMQEPAFREHAQLWRSYLGRKHGMVRSLLT